MREVLDEARVAVGAGRHHARQYLDDPDVSDYDERIKTEVNRSLDAICERLDRLKGSARAL